jgi:hypothetical protein
MKQAEFESLLFVEVADRAAAEPTPRPGTDKYYRRPWLQLRDEMVAGDALTVADLRADRIVAFYHATQPANRGVKSIFKGLLSGN